MVSLKKLVLLLALISPCLAHAQSWNAYAASPTNAYGLMSNATIPDCFQCGAPFIIEVPDADTAGFWKFSAPVLSVNGDAGPAGYGNGGVWVTKATLQSPEFPLGAGPSTFGATPVNTMISIPFSPNNAGHITSMTVSNLSTATCPTPPVFNVIDFPGGVSSGSDTVGTPLAAPGTGAINGTAIAKNAQSMPFNGGDLIFLFINTAGSGCTTSTFSVSAEVSIP
jgi:hypothetical protein